jgi:hypothetical protein
MKKNVLVIMMTLACTLSFSQEVKTYLKTVEITLYNNSVLPHKFSMISYAPDETGNGTRVKTFLPFGSMKIKFKVGTKLYLATQRETDVVMSGSKLTGKPFKIIKEGDDKMRVNLNN